MNNATPAAISLFKPKAELSAHANLVEFIAFAKTELTVFGANLDFDADSWDVTEAASLKGKNSKLRLRFTGYPSTQGRKDGVPLAEPFKSFAKAYMRYSYGLNPTTSFSHKVAAVRALELALLDFGHADPSKATLHTFNRAAQHLAERFGAASQSGAGQMLAQIAEGLTQNCLVAVPIPWRCAAKAHQTTARVGAEFDAIRNSKLPSVGALSAIAEIFQVANDPSDIFVTSACAILTSAPSRINEMLNLSINCEVHATDPKTGAPVYGIRWIPSKGGEPVIKWVLPAMVSVTQEAIANLRELSAPAREVAVWYEQHPRNVYLPLHLRHLRTKPRLNNKEICDILFATHADRIKPEQQGAKWCTTKKLTSIWEGGSPAMGGCNTVAFKDVEREIIAMLPAGFPIADKATRLKYSEALCLVRRNELTGTLSTSRCMILRGDQSVVYSRLVGSISVKTIFEKHGYTEADGSPLRLTSHQFRHYLNTLAQMGGLSEMDIAKWSGRARVTQNSVYDHESDRDVLARVRAAIGDSSKLFGPLATLPKVNLVSRDEFANLRVLTAHTTDFGYCVHDFSMMPCQTHRDCLNCPEQVCIKGDQVREQAIRAQQAETRDLLAKANVALADGERSANRWVQHQELTLSRLDQLVALLDDPQVLPGAIIQPAGVVAPSHLEQAAARRLNPMESPQAQLAINDLRKKSR